jgi:hypothetical protein
MSFVESRHSIVHSGVKQQLAAVFRTVAFVQDRDDSNKSSKHDNKTIICMINMH